MEQAVRGPEPHINIYLTYLSQETRPPKGTRCVRSPRLEHQGVFSLCKASMEAGLLTEGDRKAQGE